MKRSLSLLLAVIFLFLLAVPVSAKSLDDLGSVCASLKEYLYTPYVSDSALYPAYEEALSKAEDLVAKNKATPGEVDAHYNALKSAFAALFRDCFDYSSLDQAAKDYESLSSSLFEKESWEMLESVAKVISKEIESPTLFKRGNTDKAGYTLYVEKFIYGHFTDFLYAFNQLKLKPLPENIELKELVGLLNYCSLSAPEALMSQSAYWSGYQNACKQVRDLSEQTPEQESIDLAAKELLDAYRKLSVDFFDLSSIKKEVERYRSLSSNHYSQKSWASYQLQIENLQSLENAPIFLYLTNFKNTDEANASIENYFAEMTKSAALAFESLVPQENINKLSALCNTYRHATASPGVEVKLKLLLESVDRGYKVLTSEASSSQDVDKAIEDIEADAENLLLAEEYLSSELSDNVKNDVVTIRYILIFALLTLILSTVCACVFSNQQFGRIDWQR